MKTLLTHTAILFLISTPAAAAPCQWSVDKESLTVTATGYKFTEKSGVKGTLEQVALGGPETAESSRLLLHHTSFTIDARSINSGDTTRDTNLRETFIANMNSPYISGRISQITGPTSLVVSVTMNGVTREVPFQYEVAADKSLRLQGSIDVLDFALEGSLAALAERCKELHTGKDGVTKTWSTIDIAVAAQLLEKCEE